MTNGGVLDLVLIAVTPLCLFLWCWAHLPDTTWNLDPNGQKYGFLTLFDRYQSAYRNLSLVAMPLAVLGWWAGVEVAPALLAASAVFAIIWQVVMIHFYELSLHKPDSYTTVRYSVVTALGASTVLLFVFGVVAGLAEGVRR